MRAVIQRVSRASVTANGKFKAETGAGLLVFAGIEEDDDISDVEWLAGKIVQLRVFNDKDGIMNLSVTETGGSIMVISQFTLHAKTKKGNRPSYIRAARPEKAIPLYEKFVERITLLTGRETATGEFGAMMDVSLVNDGPVTIIIDTRNRE
ncbi:MAG: D-tyrosyl-tRNA(Tyr) deacylase [Bacteroidales bacterium]|nr:D-tyrosyl-tRNA(Tyr) deacylase [Bacteroidales bacterium]MBN2633709.1 D-tyrosyl-tRNA(Tyr) deacylase [Bacteroidales bacterium]